MVCVLGDVALALSRIVDIRFAGLDVVLRNQDSLMVFQHIDSCPLQRYKTRTDSANIGRLDGARGRW